MLTDFHSTSAGSAWTPQITTDHRTLTRALTPTLTLIITPTWTVHLRWSAPLRCSGRPRQHAYAMHAERHIVMANPSVRLSVTLCTGNVWKRMHLSSNSLHHLVEAWIFFSAPPLQNNFNSFSGGVKHGGGKNTRFSIEIAVYLENGTR